MTITHVTDAEFDEKVLKAPGPYWWIFGPNGAARARLLRRPWKKFPKR